MRYDSGSSSSRSKKKSKSRLAQLSDNPFAQNYLTPGLGVGTPAPPQEEPLLSGMSDTARNGPISAMKKMQEWLDQGREGDVAPLEELNASDVAAQQLGALANQLFGGGASYDPSADIAAAASGINQTYNPQIQALKAQNETARKRTGQNTAKITAMYEALNKSMQKDADVAAQGDKSVAKGFQEIGKRVAESITNNVKDTVAANNEAAKGLGSAALAAELNVPLQKQNQSAADSAQRMAADSAVANTKIGAASQRSMREIGSSTKLEGAERNADLIAQMQDFVQQNMTKAQSLRGQRATDIAQAKAQITGAAGQAQQQNSQNLWDAMMQIAKMQQGDRQNEFDNWATQQKLLGQGDNDQFSLYPKSQRILQQAQSGSNADLGAAYMEILGTLGNQAGQLNDAQVYAQIRRLAPELSEADRQALLAAIQSG